MNPLHQHSPNPASRRTQATPGEWKSPWAIDADDPPVRPRVPPPETAPIPPSPQPPAPKPVAPTTNRVTSKAAASPSIPVAQAQAPVEQRSPERQRAEQPPTPTRAVREPRPPVQPASAIAASKHQAIQQALSKQRRQRMSRLLVFAVGSFLFVSIIWMFTSDQESPSDDDLRPAATVDQGANHSPPRASDRLRLALEAIVPINAAEVNGRPAWEWDTPLLSRSVQQNAVALDNLRDLLTDVNWQPHHTVWVHDDLGSKNLNWEQLCLAKVAQAAYFARSGHDDEALRAALDLAQLARRVQSITAWPTMYARGVELHQRACEITAELLRTTHLTSRLLANYQAEFETNAPSDEQLREALADFYTFEKQLIIGSPGYDPSAAQRPSRLFFKPNQTLGLFAQTFRDLRSDLNRPINVRPDPILRLDGQLRSSGMVFTPNRSGLQHATTRLRPYAQLVDRQSLQATRHLIVLTLFAVRRYSIDHTRLPQTLSDVVPTYLTELPNDPFTGEPLHYDPLRGVLYSVGQDYRDTGGHVAKTPLSDAYEPTVSVK